MDIASSEAARARFSQSVSKQAYQTKGWRNGSLIVPNQALKVGEGGRFWFLSFDAA
jgi:hypothetical protein